VLVLGAILLLSAVALGILGLVKRGYELLVVMAMMVLFFIGIVLLVKGILG
jgi:hypothetical protein